jgi:hypothetical protein
MLRGLPAMSRLSETPEKPQLDNHNLDKVSINYVAQPHC